MDDLTQGEPSQTVHEPIGSSRFDRAKTGRQPTRGSRLPPTALTWKSPARLTRARGAGGGSGSATARGRVKRPWHWMAEEVVTGTVPAGLRWAGGN